jgi:hypothetical protein
MPRHATPSQAPKHGFLCYDLQVTMRLFRTIFLLVLMMPLIVSCASDTTSPPAPVKAPDEPAALTALKDINRAQADFIRRTRRYAQTFEELIADHLLSEEPKVDATGYEFRMRPSPDAVSYTLTATPNAPESRYFFTDQTGTIRVESGKPATAESPGI